MNQADVASRLGVALADKYRIERELGQGGMALVYLAHDVRHDRSVALKVLRPELAAILGGERFLKEIRLTANLQHPHILPLHDSGEVDGIVYYVMPYVEGESLRDRLARDKQLPVEEAIRITREVASALDYAHRHNVVHRDIKPENILLHDGSALVADFGIALAVSTAGGGTRMTETGMSLGTPHYMAPEQAMGDRDITPRADIYALGVVAYEMLTGDPPFTGSTAQAIVARVVTESPRPMVTQRHTIPLHVEAAVLTALEKLPADRFASAAEFAAALANPGFTATTAIAPALRRHRDWRGRIAIPMAIVAVLATALAVWSLTRPTPVHAVRRYGLALPERQAPRPDRPFAMSRDGSHLLYVGPGENGTQLWLKAADRYDAVPLSGTAGVNNFTFSPDGQWIAYVQNGSLKKLPIIGGAAITLADSLSGNLGLAWLDDHSIVYIQVNAHQLKRIADVGGPATVVWHSDTALGVGPVALPGSRGVLFTRCVPGCTAEQDLWALDLRSGASHRVQAGATMGQYVSTGHILYVRRDGGMFALPFDPKTLQVRGAPTPVLDSVSVVNGVFPLVSVSADGMLLFRPGSAITSRVWFQMVWVDRGGRQTMVDSSWTLRHVVSGGNAGWALSPDGTRLAIGLATDAGDDIWIKQLPRGPLSRLTFDSSAEYRPRWSADGRAVYYSGLRSGVASVYRKRADGTGSEDLVLRVSASIHEVAHTRDEQWVVIRAGGTLGQAGARDIFAQHIGVDSVPRPLIASPVFDEAAIALSPDGHWIAYETNETGRTEVYLRPFPNVDAGKWQVSTSGGVAPLWARNGRELFFVDAGRNMVGVTVAPGPVPRLGERHNLFHLGDDIYLAPNENYTPHDITADGRFLMARRVRSEAAQSTPLIVTENWFEELKQKLGRSLQ